jgi:hypothetical protein
VKHKPGSILPQDSGYSRTLTVRTNSPTRLHWAGRWRRPAAFRDFERHGHEIAPWSPASGATSSRPESTAAVDWCAPATAVDAPQTTWQVGA